MAKTGRGQGRGERRADLLRALRNAFSTERAEAKRKASTEREYHPLFDHVIVPALGKKRGSGRPRHGAPLATSIEKVVERTIGDGTATPPPFLRARLSELAQPFSVKVKYHSWRL